MKTIGPQTAQALDMIAQLKRCEADLARVQAEQRAAKEQRDQMATTLAFIKQCEAVGQQRRRAARTPYIF